MTEPKDFSDLFNEVVDRMEREPGMTLDPERIYRRRQIEAAGDGERLRRETNLIIETAAIRADVERLDAPIPAKTAATCASVERPSAPPPANKGEADTPSRTEQRVKAIIQTASRMGYDLSSVAWGGKASIKRECMKENPRLFTGDTFLKAWQAARKAGLIDVENAETYRTR